MKRFRKIVGVLLAGLVLASASTAWAAAKRVALVIGNDAYETLPSLNNAGKDARDIAAKLEKLGFDVILKTNAKRRDISRALSDFEESLQGAEAGLAFYAGHGIQADGINYLIPSDARIEVEEDLRFEGIDSAEFLKSMARADAPVNLVILDACRDNPLPKRSRSASRGLAVVEVPSTIKGTAILYSAGKGETAADGPKGGNGVFTGALLAALDRPGLTVEQVFKETARAVSKATGGRQTPWNNSSLTGDFYFNGDKASAQPVAPATQSGAEIVFWQSIEDSTRGDDFCAYLEAYPQGSFAPLAKRRAAQYAGACGKGTQSAAVLSAPASASGPAPSRSLQPGDSFVDCENAHVADAGHAPTDDFCGPEMIVVPAGTFRMGDVNNAGDADEQPVHRVTIAKPFAVGKHEVTQSLWQAIMGTNPSRFKGERKPVEQVSWDEVTEFLQRLSGRTGVTYRLPSEAEWEYAARAGSKTVYPWGNAFDKTRAKYRSRESAPVGSYPANAFGLYDMIGNVWEWTADCRNDKYAGAPDDGSAWTTGTCQAHVTRGGSWQSKPGSLRTANRNGSSTGDRSSNLGFRVARDLP